MLDLTNRLVVVIGGGAVAVRKVRGLLDAGAGRVRVVSPEIDPKMPAGAELVTDLYDPAHLDGATLVFAATNLPAVNDAVVRDANARGVLVNRADADAELAGDFATPAMFRDGPVAVTVSAGSPLLSVMIREGLARHYDRRWTKMAEAMRDLRPRIVNDAALSPDTRAAMFDWLASERALAILDAEGVAGLIERLGRTGDFGRLGPTPDEPAK